MTVVDDMLDDDSPYRERLAIDRLIIPVEREKS